MANPLIIMKRLPYISQFFLQNKYVPGGKRIANSPHKVPSRENAFCIKLSNIIAEAKMLNVLSAAKKATICDPELSII